jgi:hypothetical protein
MEPVEPKLEPLFALTLHLGPAADVGPTPVGHRRITPITGGSLESWGEGWSAGGRFKGTVLPAEDWIVERADGAFAIDVRMPVKTEGGALVLVRYDGFRHGPADVLAKLAKGEPVDPRDYYLRILPRFETAAKPFEWLNRVLAVGSGVRQASSVLYRIWKIA